MKDATVTRVLEQLTTIGPGQTCRVLLNGLPYYAALDKFEEQAEWGAFLETPENSAAFRRVFNAFSALGAHLSDPTEFLARAGARHGIKKDLSAGSLWRSMMQVLTSCYFAREELFGTLDMARQARPTKTPHGPTTWLRYVAFTFRPQIGPELTAFLADCYNREAVIAAYLDHPGSYAMAIKLPLPLAGYEAWLLGLLARQLSQEPQLSVEVEQVAGRSTVVLTVAGADEQVRCRTSSEGEPDELWVLHEQEPVRVSDEPPHRSPS